MDSEKKDIGNHSDETDSGKVILSQAQLAIINPNTNFMGQLGKISGNLGITSEQCGGGKIDL